jgi:hypothetical protein
MNNGKLLVAGGLALGILASAGAPARAQDADTLRARFVIPVPTNLELMHVAHLSPGSSAGSPTAFGPNWGDAYVGAGFTHRAREARNPQARDNVDATVAFGFGLGNARDLVGLDVNVASFSTIDPALGTRMGVSFKAHRALPGRLAVGLGWENAITRGFTDSGSSVYGVVSHVWRPAGWESVPAIVTSLGVGNSRFRSEDGVREDRDGVNVFGSVGVIVWEPVSVLADWTGQDLVLGTSLVPFRFGFVPPLLQRVPLVITAGLADVTGHAGDGVRFVMGAGLGFRWGTLGRLFH